MTARLLATLAAVLMLGGCNSLAPMVQPMSQPSACGFMADSWRSMGETDRGIRVSEEHWLPFQSHGSIGINRLTTNGKLDFYEFLRIETTDDGTFYIAQPKGRSPGTRFAMIEHSDNRAVFENPEHDFPQRIIYERVGETLTARIEGTDNGQPHVESWSWTRARP